MAKVKQNIFKVSQNMLKPYANLLNINTKPLNAKIIESPLGLLIAVSNDKNLLMLTSVDCKHLDLELKQLTKIYSASIYENNEAEPLKLLESELSLYFKGDLTEFKTPFEIHDAMGTEFQRSVWNEIYKIGYGKTKTYSELAKCIGKPTSFRAVANACGRNPISIVIPCHRVLSTKNGTGGYSSGIEKKVWLLDLEK